MCVCVCVCMHVCMVYMYVCSEFSSQRTLIWSALTTTASCPTMRDLLIHTLTQTPTRYVYYIDYAPVLKLELVGWLGSSHKSTGMSPRSKASPLPQSLHPIRLASTRTPAALAAWRCFAKEGQASVLGRKERASGRTTMKTSAALRRVPSGKVRCPLAIAASWSRCFMARAETTFSPEGPR